MSREVKQKTARKRFTTRKTPKRYIPSEGEVRERAYEIFLSRGSEHGHHTEDWLRAEQELRRN